MTQTTNVLDLITADDYCAIADKNWPDYHALKASNSIPEHVEHRILEMLERTTSLKQQASAFCTLAFYGREYTFQRYDHLRCCDKNPSTIQDVRHTMLQGQRPQDCRRCWNKEDVGITSLRQIKNSTLDSLMDRDVTSFYQECKQTNTYPMYIYKIEVSNLCNATCVTCSSRYSTAWRKLEQQNSEEPYPVISSVADSDGIRFNGGHHTDLMPIDYKNAKFINFLGGESTLGRVNYKVLELLKEHNNTDCKISFTTHGNFDLTKAQQDLIREFANMEFNFSIDAVGKAYEYLRYPLSWKKLLSNISWCRDQGIEVSVAWTLSNLNIFYYDEIKQWLQSNNLNYYVNVAESFKKTLGFEYHVPSLSRRVKDAIMARNTSAEVHSLLTPHSEQHDLHYSEFICDLVKQDRWKKISIEHYLPEFFEIISDDYKVAQKESIPE
jgi:hypothetical protein